MKISFVDRNAVLGTSFLHALAPQSKMLAAASLLLAAVTAGRLELLSFQFLALSTLLLLTGTGLARQAMFLFYPLFFGFLFGRVLMGYTGLHLVLILLRASSSVFVLLLLISTTPYIQIFAVLNRVLPTLLVDIMFLTYRSFFTLAGKTLETVTALRLRGGIDVQSPGRSLKTTGQILGFALVNAVELNEKCFRVLLLRGYEGGIVPDREPHGQPLENVAPVILSSILLILAVLW